MKQDLTILQGKTFEQIFRWETAPIVYKPITAIVAQAPVRLTCVGHGLVDGWRAAVVSVRGMTQINAEGSPPDATDYHPVTVVDDDTVEFNDVNAAEYSAYTSGGYLQFNTPIDLTGYSARMTIKNRVGGTSLLELDSSDEIAIDADARTITLTIAPAVTELLTFSRAVYDLEMVASGGAVYELASGALKLIKEVTTTA